MNDGRGRQNDKSDQRFCPNCGKAIKQGGKFCPACGAPLGERRMAHTAASGMPVRRVETGRQRPVGQGKAGNQVGNMKKILILLLAILVCVVVYKKFFVNQQEKLMGTWEAGPGQILEIETERLTFNFWVFDYTVKGDVLILEEAFPENSVSGKMPFKLKGDTLTIDLGDTFSGRFYGRSGTVELERVDTDEEGR